MCISSETELLQDTLAPWSLPSLYPTQMSHRSSSHFASLQVSGLGPECVLSEHSQPTGNCRQETQEAGGNSWPFEVEIGQQGTWGTVDCHLFGQARLLPLCLGHSRGDKGASDRRLPSSQEGGGAGAAGRVCFQMKLCAWGLGGLRPHSCVSVCSACQAPYLISQPPGDRLGPRCSPRE